MSESCKSCKHYSFYQMITGGLYGYSGYIPCLTCSRIHPMDDKYQPIAAEQCAPADAKPCGSIREGFYCEMPSCEHRKGNVCTWRG